MKLKTGFWNKQDWQKTISKMIYINIIYLGIIILYTLVQRDYLASSIILVYIGIQYLMLMSYNKWVKEEWQRLS